MNLGQTDHMFWSNNPCQSNISDILDERGEYSKSPPKKLGRLF